MKKYMFNIDKVFANQSADKMSSTSTLDNQNQEEEFLLSKQKYKSKSMSEEYSDGLILRLREDICKVADEDWKFIKENIDKFNLQGILISYEELRELMKIPPFRDMLKQKMIKIIVNIDNTTDKPLMIDAKDTQQDSLCSLLRIFNYPGVPDLDDEVIAYMDMIITKGDIAFSAEYPLGLSGWEDDDKTCLFWMSFLKKCITVLLVPKSKMPDDDEDLLGRYYSCSHVLSEPLIVLCPERINQAAISLYEEICKKSSEVYNKPFPNLKTCHKVLYAKVLIHEFAHAVMDWTNTLADGRNTLEANAINQKSATFCQRLSTEDEKYMEESLANMITLLYFEVADNKHLDIVKTFINNHQDLQYQFGIKQFDAKVDWRKWRDYKSKKSLKMWKAYVENHPSDDIIAEEFNKVFPKDV